MLSAPLLLSAPAMVTVLPPALPLLLSPIFTVPVLLRSPPMLSVLPKVL